MSVKYPSTTGYAPVTKKDWNPDTGELVEESFIGEKSELDSLYTAAKSESGVIAVQMQYANGRGSLAKRYERLVAGETPAPGVSQELSSVDLVKSIYTHPYFASLTNAQMVSVRDAFEKTAGESGSWSTLQKSLYYHLVHGQEEYYETTFVFRSTRRVGGSRALSISTSNINEVVTAPTATGAMANLIASLPSGEWLKRPPTVRFIRAGVWEASEEWHWAKAWSVIYGGSFGLITTTA